MIALDARPRLAAKARLRHDRVSGRTLLLYPERGLELNATGAHIVRLCTGDNSVADIIAALAVDYGKGSELTVEVRSFLESLAERGLLLDLES